MLGAKAAARPADANRILDESVTNLPRGTWPAPVLRYFQGELTRNALLNAAANQKQATEARAFLGVEQLLSGDTKSAGDHLRWASDHAQPGSIAGDAARAFLARIESGMSSNDQTP